MKANRFTVDAAMASSNSERMLTFSARRQRQTPSFATANATGFKRAFVVVILSDIPFSAKPQNSPTALLKRLGRVHIMQTRPRLRTLGELSPGIG